MQLVIAEKPSVARDLAQVLGVKTQGRSYFQSDRYYISWAIGHLVTLAEPQQINASWQKWREADLPILPKNWPLVVLDRTAEQFQQIKALMDRPDVTSIVAATDAGREGELIFRYIYEKAGCKKPAYRLWLSSLTAESIREAFQKLRPIADYDRLADNARGRSRSDWLVGLNLSRAYSLKYNERWSVGRVQTPTLAMLVERTEAIQNFVPEPYRELEVHFQTQKEQSYKSMLVEKSAGKAGLIKTEARRFAPNDPELAAIRERALRGEARVQKREDKEQKIPPPLFYDLTELQKDANRLFGFQAKQTLDIAQKLYESHKLITYPRSDSRHLSSTVAKSLPDVVSAIRGPYEEFDLSPRTGQSSLTKLHVDDGKVSDHHAIIPTGKSAKNLRLSSEEEKIFDLIARRLLMAWQDDHVRSQSSIHTVIRSEEGGEAKEDHYRASGSLVIKEGWKKLERRAYKSSEGNVLPLVAAGEIVAVTKAEILDKQTKAPAPLSDATLLNAMASAGSRLDDKELTDILREKGLGTPATRAAIIETLLQRGYAERREKSLWATELGIRLIHQVHPTVRSAALTGEWEAKLRKIEAGELSLAAFTQEIEAYVTETIRLVKAANPSTAGSNERKSAYRAESGTSYRAESTGANRAESGTSYRAESTGANRVERAGASRVESAGASFAESTGANRVERAGASRAEERLERRPAAAKRASENKALLSPNAEPLPELKPLPQDVNAVLRTVFGHNNFRPYQEDICREIVQGNDLLLVMPTGAGKSLCYQLPALVRQGCTLVISPLIALMADQVQKLRQLNVPAAALYSGLSREESRAICRDYASGRLKLLYLAPERLGLSGFLDFLAQNPPGLIAVDEAHCISQWGHDFRPDYRMLAQRLPRLRPAPIVGMTATATPLVQDDIQEQLGMISAKRHIHGFRRSNIAVEISEVSLPDRPDVIRSLLKEGNKPAIIYAPTRKETENLAKSLRGSCKVEAYHAGLPHETRQQIQADFQANRLDAIVATIAFGMGIDKANIRMVIHSALPSSVEGYYQEIGRAGRDGQFSRAVLLHSYADHRTREFFIKKNYPDISVLEGVLKKIPRGGIARSEIRSGLEPDAFDNALEKLWIHGAIDISADDRVVLQDGQWQNRYRSQQTHKLAEFRAMVSFAENQHTCRMLQFLEHFGDRTDRAGPCGLCDVCRPLESLTKASRRPTTTEETVLRAILSRLAEQRRMASAHKIFQSLEAELGIDRKLFDACVEALVRQELLWSQHDTFLKDGKQIPFRTLGLTARNANDEGVWDNLRIIETQAGEGGGSSSRSRKGKKGKGKDKRKGASRESGKEKTSRAPSERQGAMVSEQDLDNPLAQSLRGWRLRRAKQERVPAYRIFSDRTLLALVRDLPRNQDELRSIEGVGPITLEKYGHEILKIMSSH